MSALLIDILAKFEKLLFSIAAFFYIPTIANKILDSLWKLKSVHTELRSSN